MHGDACVVYVTCGSDEEAVVLANRLVEERLAACANIVSGVRSIYRWEGAVQDERECLLIIKTSQAVFDALQSRIRELHSYTVPECIALPVLAGSADYLAWLRESVGSSAGGLLPE